MTRLTLLQILKDQKDSQLSGGFYHKLQVEMTYNSNHIEGSRLSHEQTQYIFDTDTIIPDKSINVDDLIETVNHFRCIDKIIDEADVELSEKFIKILHFSLKNGTTDSQKEWFEVGDYKKIPNEVNGLSTTPPEKVKTEVKKLLDWYNNLPKVDFEKIIEFHVKFEGIHPFQDGNGRVGRLIALKECLKHNIVPFIIDDDLKLFYYRGLKAWQSPNPEDSIETQHGYLLDTCRAGQDKVKSWLDYFKINYDK